MVHERNTAYVGVRTKYSGVGGEGCSSSSINTHYRQPLRVPRRPSSISFTPDTISLPHSISNHPYRYRRFRCSRDRCRLAVRVLSPRATKNTDQPTRASFTVFEARYPFRSRPTLHSSSRVLFFVTREREKEGGGRVSLSFILLEQTRVGFRDRFVRMKRSLRFSRLRRWLRFTSSR